MRDCGRERGVVVVIAVVLVVVVVVVVVFAVMEAAGTSAQVVIGNVLLWR